MKEELISFETAKLAKEVGCKSSLGLSPLASDFTQSLLQRWLREKHKVLVWIKPVPNVGKWSVYVDDTVGRHLVADYIFKDTYEEALEAGLLETLKLIKT